MKNIHSINGTTNYVLTVTTILRFAHATMLPNAMWLIKLKMGAAKQSQTSNHVQNLEQDVVAACLLSSLFSTKQCKKWARRFPITVSF
jgi:hypothetical protein